MVSTTKHALFGLAAGFLLAEWLRRPSVAPVGPQAPTIEFKNKAPEAESFMRAWFQCPQCGKIDVWNLTEEIEATEYLCQCGHKHPIAKDELNERIRAALKVPRVI